VKDLVLVFINMDDALTSIALKKLYREGKHFKQYSLGLCPGLLQTNMVMIPVYCKPTWWWYLQPMQKT